MNPTITHAILRSLPTLIGSAIGTFLGTLIGFRIGMRQIRLRWEAFRERADQEWAERVQR